MQKVCLDTNIIIDFLRSGEDYEEIFKKLEAGKLKAFISSATSFELYCGAFLSNNKEQEFVKIDNLLKWFEIISVDKFVSFLSAKIFAELRKKGALSEVRDILISACAISKRLILATKNKIHFENISELKLL